jgi:hypothetical protein
MQPDQKENRRDEVIAPAADIAHHPPGRIGDCPDGCDGD